MNSALPPWLFLSAKSALPQPSPSAILGPQFPSGSGKFASGGCFTGQGAVRFLLVTTKPRAERVRLADRERANVLVAASFGSEFHAARPQIERTEKEDRARHAGRWGQT